MTAALSSQGQVIVRLPDQSTKNFDHEPTGFELAESISKSLAKAAVAMKIDGVQRDLSESITHNSTVALLTSSDEEGLDVIRHSITAQLLAKAIKLLWPEAKLAIGPTIEHGFFYDVDLDKPISIDDLPEIETKMREILATKANIQREMWLREDAIALFESRGESYKAQLIRDAEEGDTTEAGKISLYRQGEGDDAFIDLCRGPHVPSLAKISPAFKLTKVAGAYWRGDAKNKMLQRIYGVAFADNKALKAHLTMLEEAEKRDHRKIGKALDLFHFQEEATGVPFWHDKGWQLYQQIQNYVRRKLRANGYQEVNTPVLVNRVLWEQSGHWEKFRENMFISDSDEDRTLAVKPMNCPCHVQIFKQGITSYKDLPIRMAEFGTCHRNEPSGALHGLMRVRGFNMDDAHIFCMEEQINSETVAFCELLQQVYKDFGFTDIQVKFADRPETRAGSDETWNKAENALKEAVAEAGLEWTLNPGEGAFYGPKLEFVLRDAIGRDWQCGTLQVDFVLPERLDAHYIGKDGEKYRPVMLHRAILGSMERFIGILIEHYAGRFPLWLAPVQAVVTTITNEVDDYAHQVYTQLKEVGLRVEIDTSSNKINYKVREHSNRKIPYILAVGAREQEEQTVAVRKLGEKGQQVQSLSDVITLLQQQAKAPA